MKALEFDKLATPVDKLLSRGYLAIGLILCLINEKQELLLFEEKNVKPGIKMSGEWGLPAETCKYGERLRDTVARCFNEELHLNQYDGVVYPKGGYYESNFIDEVGIARVTILRCESAIFHPDPKNIVSQQKASNEIGSIDWLSFNDTYKVKLRRGMLEVVGDIEERVESIFCQTDNTPLKRLLYGAVVHSFSEDIAPKDRWKS